MTSASRKSGGQKKAGSKASKKKAGAKKAPAKKKAGTKKTSAKAGTTSKKKAKRAAPAPSALEVDADVLEFIEAIDAYKLQNSRPFPSWSEVLHVLRELGYRKA